eukprot:scaffold115931_cov19-Tisochrysis_lutea.AAC.1
MSTKHVWQGGKKKDAMTKLHASFYGFKPPKNGKTKAAEDVSIPCSQQKTSSPMVTGSEANASSASQPAKQYSLLTSSSFSPRNRTHPKE